MRVFNDFCSFVKRCVLLGNVIASSHEETVSLLHDVSLVDASDLVSAVLQSLKTVVA